MQVRDIFEIDYAGARDVCCHQLNDVHDLNMGLDTLELTKTVFVTEQSDLRQKLQIRYMEKCAVRVSKLLAKTK